MCLEGQVLQVTNHDASDLRKKAANCSATLMLNRSSRSYWNLEDLNPSTHIEQHFGQIRCRDGEEARQHLYPQFSSRREFFHAKDMCTRIQFPLTVA
ncbi:hypothetical protein E4U10_000413 [Claviceps purpurea]|nr:hypothetical protein E4U10_000413 [Claviceps purpurea]